jgi:sialidase-1
MKVRPGPLTVEKVLDVGPSGYSDIAIAKDGTIYCLYETSPRGAGWNYRLILKKFTVEWLTDGKDEWRKR